MTRAGQWGPAHLNLTVLIGFVELESHVVTQASLDLSVAQAGLPMCKPPGLSLKEDQGEACSHLKMLWVVLMRTVKIT